METRGRLALASALLGLLSLWVGLGRGTSFVFLGPNACQLTGGPDGLYLNEFGHIVYRRCGTVFEYAWPVLIALTVLGTTLLATGVRLSLRGDTPPSLWE